MRLVPIVIDHVRPATPTFEHAAKAVEGRPVHVRADVYRDGHDVLGARVRWRAEGGEWRVAPLRPVGNDAWEGTFTPTTHGPHEFRVQAWTDRYASLRRSVEAKRAAGQDVSVELEETAMVLEDLLTDVPDAARAQVEEAIAGLRNETCSVDVRLTAGFDEAVARVVAEVPDPHDLTGGPAVPLRVDRERGGWGAWYELFPRSEGGLEGATRGLDRIADMGFDVVYLPPVHPIGESKRKGRNNSLVAGPGDPGSPWAIGSPAGGHDAVHPDLGTIEDFDRFVERARELGMEVALDYALQCSPDHPWVEKHPEWFHHRPDGTIKFAENPPKKYEDIYPINFWPAREQDREALWQACRDVLLHWIEHGVRIFRVDNPHTKPFVFWEWMIGEIHRAHPDVVFLAEAFTRPKVMAKLAEIGFTQSYTYFTWRTAKWELEQYLRELSSEPLVDFMRPNFWPNTPDILSGPLRNGPRAAFQLRVVLAATMVPNYGIYSGYELCENEPASDTNEEYLWSEKYEIKHRDWDQPGSLAPLLTHLNATRRRHPALTTQGAIRFHGADHDAVICYSRHSDVDDDVVLVVANLDPFDWHECTLALDLPALGLPPTGPYEAHDELHGDTYRWEGPHPYVRLDPGHRVAHVLTFRPFA